MNIMHEDNFLQLYADKNLDKNLIEFLGHFKDRAFQYGAYKFIDEVTDMIGNVVRDISVNDVEIREQYDGDCDLCQEGYAHIEIAFNTGNSNEWYAHVKRMLLHFREDHKEVCY